MTTIGFETESFDLQPGETVLEGLLRHGRYVPYSCQIGACRTCLMRATEGQPPAAAQIDLTPDEIARSYFMACVCVPTSNLVVESL